MYMKDKDRINMDKSCFQQTGHFIRDTVYSVHHKISPINIRVEVYTNNMRDGQQVCDPLPNQVPYTEAPTFCNIDNNRSSWILSSRMYLGKTIILRSLLSWN